METLHSPPDHLNCQRGFQQMAHACLDEIRRSHPSALRGDADGVHRMRIAFTRLGAARKFFSAMVTDSGWRAVQREIAWLNDILGEARDSDVALDYAEAKLAIGAARVGRHRISADVSVSHARATRALASKRYRGLFSALQSWIDHGPWTTSSDPALDELRRTSLEYYASHRLKRWSLRLARWHGRPTKAGRQHRIRIMAKRFRYIVEALAGQGIALPRKRLRQARAAQELQRILGDLRDLRRARRRIGAPHTRRFHARRNKLSRQVRHALDGFS